MALSSKLDAQSMTDRPILAWSYEAEAESLGISAGRHYGLA